jgi:hypothetical protein
MKERKEAREKVGRKEGRKEDLEMAGGLGELPGGILWRDHRYKVFWGQEETQ